MNILFPASLNSSREVSEFWQKEAAAAEAIGFEISIISESHFGSPISIYNHKSPYLYRGWILKPQDYAEMDGLVNSKLQNSFENYMWSYNFPEWYGVLADFTPSSLIIPADEIRNSGLVLLAEQIANMLGDKSVMIKDYLKSRKHEWYEACFIRDASDEKELVRVMTNFFNLQGRDFYGGLIFRDFIDLKKVGFHPKSKMPLPLEFRTFFLNGKPIFTTPYWSNDAQYPEDFLYPPEEWLSDIGKLLKSPFVALDIAQGEDGRWWVIEVNDGGSAGLPDHVNLEEFYQILKNNL